MSNADRTQRVPVVIAGAGPAGLVAAVTLARNGIGSLLVERNPGLSPLPRATAVSVRTMELLRSWGLEAAVRAGQLDISAVGAWATETMASPEGSLLPLGHPDFEHAAAASPTTLAGVPQDHLEPVLLRHLEASGLAEARFGTELVALDQDADGVTFVLSERATGAERTLRAAYVVGADGAHSRMRTMLGIAMDGPDHLNEQLTVLFEAPLGEVVGDRRYGIYFIQHPEAGGVLVPNGSSDRWLYGRGWDLRHERLEDYDDAHLTHLIRTAAGVGDLAVRVVAKGAFSFAAQVAERYRQGRAFLVGTAASSMPGSPPATATPAPPSTSWARASPSSPPRPPSLDLRHRHPRQPVPPRRPAARRRDTAATLAIDPDGAILARTDAQVVASWPTPPADPRAELAALLSRWVEGLLPHDLLAAVALPSLGTVRRSGPERPTATGGGRRLSFPPGEGSSVPRGSARRCKGTTTVRCRSS